METGHWRSDSSQKVGLAVSLDDVGKCGVVS